MDLTERSLLDALCSPDAQVRYLAAAELAEQKAESAIPAITEALVAEKIPATRINIASALAQFGQDRGVVELTSACENADLDEILRVRATTYLLDLQKESCLDATIKMLKPEADPGSRVQALSLLPRYRHVSATESKEIFDLMVKALEDQVPALRINAGIALGALGELRAIPPLEKAIRDERDPVIRSQMQASLEMLQQKKAQ